MLVTLKNLTIQCSGEPISRYIEYLNLLNDHWLALQGWKMSMSVYQSILPFLSKKLSWNKTRLKCLNDLVIEIIRH